MKVTLNRLAIAFVGLAVVLFSLLKLGLPILGILKILPFLALLAVGVIIIIAALKRY